MLKELEGIKKVLEFDRVNVRFENKLHLVNDILISYGFFLQAYVIQKKFRFLNLGDQEKLKGKRKLTYCVSKQFNGMYTARAMNQNNRRSIITKRVRIQKDNKLFSVTTARCFSDTKINS